MNVFTPFGLSAYQPRVESIKQHLLALKRRTPACKSTQQEEGVVFSRLLYRNTNQHRHSKVFKRLDGCCRKTRDVIALPLESLYHHLLCSYIISPANMNSIPSTSVQILPSLNHAHFALIELLSHHDAISDAAEFAARAFESLEHELLAPMLFLPFALTGIDSIDLLLLLVIVTISGSVCGHRARQSLVCHSASRH